MIEQNNSPGKRPPSKCRVVMSRIYFSRIMQMIYLSLIILCIASIILNFLIQVDVSGKNYSAHTTLIVLEILICIIIISEISIRIYLQGSSTFCTISNLFDVLITLLCIVGIILSLQNKLLKSFESTTIDVLLIVRNIVFLARLVLVFKNQKQSNVISVNLMQKEKPIRINLMTLNEMKLFGKYQPKMEVLLEEEDEEESLPVSSNAWKGNKV